MKKTICGCILLLFVVPGFAQADAEIPEIDSLLKISATLVEQKKFDKALEVNEVAENLALEKVGRQTPAFANVCFNYGWILQAKGNYPEAEKWYAESCAIREKVLGREHRDYASSLHQLGAIYYLNGNNYDKAERCYLQAKAIREKILGKDDLDYATTINALGNLYFYSGNLMLAEAHYREALAIREKKLGTENIYYSGCLNNLGMVSLALGRYEEAESYYKANISIIAKTKGKNTVWYAGGIFNLSGVYRAKKDYKTAEQLLLQCKNILDTLHETELNYVSCMAALGTLYFETGRYDLSEIYHLKAKSIRGRVLGKEHLSYEMSLADLSELYWKMGRYEAAAVHFAETAVRQRAHLSTAARHFSEREVASFLSIFSDEIDQFYSFATTHSNHYHLVAEECFNNALFHRGFLLNTAYLIRNTPNPAQTEKLNALKSCQRLLALEYSKPDSEQDKTLVINLENQTNAIEKYLTHAFAGYGETIRQISWQEVSAALGPGEAALEFVHFNYYKPEPTDSILYAALLLTAGMKHPLFLPLFEEKSLEALLTPPHQALFEYVNHLYSDEALVKLIWSPLMPHLNGIKTVYFSATGLLHRLNLAALPLGEHSRLSDRFELVALGSSRQLVATPSQPPAPTPTVVFGAIHYELDSAAITSSIDDDQPGDNRGLSFAQTDSTLRGDTWRYLKWSEKEVDNIRTALSQAGIDARIIKSWQATEESFKQIGRSGPSPRILHVSTHGYFFPDPATPPSTNPQSATRNPQSGEPVFKLSDHPMIRSGLILAGANHAWKTGRPLGNREDGILTAYEISQLDLRNTELVVLSACETGLGHIEGNEGVYGLQRAFKIAGAKTLVMSLWQVPDYQTQELMTVFYRKWLSGKMPVRQALHAAQKEMRDKGYEPFYWAGFVVVE
ncbi:MAG: CHAT domain-containing protein [Thermoanaerobaculia bacterium]|nr:CHAT domain-containing protein [Thermoanaerobaculia bacterium]